MFTNIWQTFTYHILRHFQQTLPIHFPTSHRFVFNGGVIRNSSYNDDMMGVPSFGVPWNATNSAAQEFIPSEARKPSKKSPLSSSSTVTFTVTPLLPAIPSFNQTFLQKLQQKTEKNDGQVFFSGSEHIQNHIKSPRCHQMSMSPAPGARNASIGAARSSAAWRRRSRRSRTRP